MLPVAAWKLIALTSSTCLVHAKKPVTVLSALTKTGKEFVCPASGVS